MMTEAETEFPRYDSCRERGEETGCEVLKYSVTQLGPAYSCPVCQMTYVQTSKGAFIPYDQAMELAIRAAKRRQKTINQKQEFQAKARKKSKKRRKR